MLVCVCVCVCIITFRVRRSRGEMYIGHGRVCVCLPVPRCIPTLLHGPGSTEVLCPRGHGSPCDERRTMS